MLIVRRGIKLTLTQKKAPLVAGVDNPLRSFRSHSWSRSGRPRLFTTEGLIVLLLVVNCAIADLKGYICCKCRTLVVRYSHGFYLPYVAAAYSPSTFVSLLYLTPSQRRHRYASPSKFLASCFLQLTSYKVENGASPAPARGLAWLTNHGGKQDQISNPEPCAKTYKHHLLLVGLVKACPLLAFFQKLNSTTAG